MEALKQNQGTFDRLHEQFVPKLYHAALCILGESEIAAQAAAQAFLETVSDPALCKDERAFGLHADQVLVRSCAKLQTCGRGYTPPVELSQTLIGMLSGMDFSERCMVTLAAGGRSVHEIARILRQPEWIAAKRLRRVTETLCECRVSFCC